MMKGNGVPKFDGIAIGEVGINLLGPSVHISAIYAFTNAASGDRFGRGSKDGTWSEETMKRFFSFLESLESDVCTDVFDGGGTLEAPQTITTDDQGIKSL
jgi:hypothetical protein